MNIYERLKALSETDRTYILLTVTWYSEHQMKERYDDMLDEAYGTVKVAGLEYATSTALASVDPIAYRCGFSDYCAEDAYCEYDDAYFDADELEKALDHLDEIRSEA